MPTTALKILVADDDSSLRELLLEILASEGHHVTQVGDGNEAQKKLKENKFDLVISDMQMPNVSGVDLLQWVKANYSVPFMLITGFSNLFETKQAFELGADDFLTKPFTRKDIKEAIARALENDAKNQADNESHYCRIPIEDFVSSEGFQVNVYAKLSDTKFVRVAHKGDTIPVERVETYQKKGVNFLYAKKSEFAKVVGFNLELSNFISNSKSIERAKKLRFLKYTSELVLENCFVNGLNPDSFKQANECLNTCISIVSENEKLFDTIEVLNKHSNWLYAHCLGVSIYSVMIGRKLGWKAHSTLFKLALSGLLHDIGSKELPVELLTKDRSLMTQEERKLYESHPTRSKQILQEMGDIPEDIIQVVHEHHEEGDGTGYPRHIMKSKIHPLVRIVALADEFCELVVDSPTRRGMSPDEAVLLLSTQASNDIDQKELAALRAICMPVQSKTAER